MQLQGKVAIVTGASSGIGWATAKLFAREGAKLVVTARREDRLTALVAEIGQDGGEAVAVAGDIAEESVAAEVARVARIRFGGLDVAFNNAGDLGEMAPVEDISLPGWRRTLDVNLTAGFLCAKHQIPLMRARGGGSLVFTSTFVGHTVGFPMMGAYAAAKAGLIGLVQVIAAELGPSGIRANAILSGGVDTPMGGSVANTPEIRRHIEGLHALKRIALPVEIARTALFLASDGSSFITGSALLADGGVSITRS